MSRGSHSVVSCFLLLQVVIDAALYLSQGGPSASSSGAVAPFVGQHRLNARIDLDIREDGPGELEFKCQLGQGQ